MELLYNLRGEASHILVLSPQGYLIMERATLICLEGGEFGNERFKTGRYGRRCDDRCDPAFDPVGQALGVCALREQFDCGGERLRSDLYCHGSLWIDRKK